MYRSQPKFQFLKELPVHFDESELLIGDSVQLQLDLIMWVSSYKNI